MSKIVSEHRSRAPGAVVQVTGNRDGSFDAGDLLLAVQGVRRDLQVPAYFFSGSWRGSQPTLFVSH